MLHGAVLSVRDTILLLVVFAALAASMGDELWLEVKNAHKRFKVASDIPDEV